MGSTGPLFFVLLAGLMVLPKDNDSENSAPQSDEAVTRKADIERFVREVGKAGDIAALAEPVIEDLGCRLVRVIISGRDGGTVQIMADRADRAISVDDCADISRNLSPLLDAHDPMPSGYYLEVSSPGIDRPLVRATDFEDWSGFEAKIELKEMLDGQKRYRGKIDGFEDGEVRLIVELQGYDEPQTIGFPVEMIDGAKLVMSDKLIAAAAPKK